MHRTRIKICGIKDRGTLAAAVEAGADAVGFVFVPASPRAVTVEQACELMAQLPAFVEPVGLFVDAPLDEVRWTSQMLGLRTVQLHGQETPEQVAQLAPLRVVKSMAFKQTSDSQQLDAWRGLGGPGNLSGMLFDAPPPAHHDPSLTGGSGRSFDWQRLAQMRSSGGLSGLPAMVLAGGLTPENVGRAVRELGPFAVDVSSGVERQRGLKDPQLIRRFCAAVRTADAERAAAECG